MFIDFGERKGERGKYQSEKKKYLSCLPFKQQPDLQLCWCAGQCSNQPSPVVLGKVLGIMESEFNTFFYKVKHL